MEAPSRPPTGRTLTPAVLLATAFMVGCIVLSIAFVAANGGLQVPQLVAAASIGPTQAGPSPEPTSTQPATPAQSEGPQPVITVPPPQLTLPPPTPAPTPTPNPITLLPRCPGLPDCWEYTVKRGDTLSEIASHYLLPVSLIEWLNPQIKDPSTIVLGDIVYLGFDGYASLPLCSDQAGCYLYVVRPGDRLSTIAGHLGITTQSIVDFDPKITDANTIYSGETIRVPGPIQCCG